MSDQRESKRPEYTLQYGKLKASVWRNYADDGSPWFSIVFGRIYLDGNNQVHYAKTFGQQDLLPLAKLAGDVWTWLARQDQSAYVPMEKPHEP